MTTRKLRLRNVRAGMDVLDETGDWQIVASVHTQDGFTTLRYEDGSEEEGPDDEQAIVASEGREG